jgi:hypothetical protein
LLVHNLGIAAPNERDDPALFGAANPHADSADNRGNQAISVSLGRSVVLTMGRLVASNSTCFASDPAWPAFDKSIGGSKTTRGRFH